MNWTLKVAQLLSFPCTAGRRSPTPARSRAVSRYLGSGRADRPPARSPWKRGGPATAVHRSGPGSPRPGWMRTGRCPAETAPPEACRGHYERQPINRSMFNSSGMKSKVSHWFRGCAFSAPRERRRFSANVVVDVLAVLTVAAVPPALPLDLNGVLTHDLVMGKQSQMLGSRLCNNHPVKRILVDGRQIIERVGVIRQDAQEDKSVCFPL